MTITARLIGSTLLAASLFPVLAVESEAAAKGEEAVAAAQNAAQEVHAIRALLGRYEAALNASDAGAVLPLYEADGVFMPAFSPSAVGAGAVRSAYDAVFRAIRLEVKFDVAEIVVVSPNWAFARTNSAGTVVVNATGARSEEANQELFVLHKGRDAQWRIARYAFSPVAARG